MNWDKAKNLTIIFLLMVNLFLGALVYNGSEKYSLTQGQEDAISKFMSQNGVSLYTTIPRNYKPKEQIRMQVHSFNMEELVTAFFGSTSNVSLSFVEGQSYNRGEEILTVNGDSFTYENPTRRSGFVLSRDNAVTLCNKFLSTSQGIFKEFSLDRVKEVREGYQVSYCGRFRNQIIVSNSITFLVTADGIANAECTYSRPVGYEGGVKEILSPDEALYIFVKHMNYIYGEQEIFLDSMDMVYFQGEAPKDTTIPTRATPYYRFYVFSGDAQVMINAYTGEIHGQSY